jgi:hypothetical protein
MTMQEGFVQGTAPPDEIRRVTREQRRNTGMYYTPVSVAQHIIRNALELWLPLAQQGKTCVTILDPACGDGIFFVESIRHLRAITPRSQPGACFEPRVYGIDIDAIALHTAKLSASLSMEDSRCNRDGEHVFLAKHDALASGTDLLFPDIKASGGFDIIVGNPPYIPWNHIPREARKVLESGHFLEATYSCRPNHEDAQPNYYLFFIVLASALVSENGVISFLLPQEWLYHERALDFRRYLLDRFKTIDVGLFPPDAKIFSEKGANAGTTSMILTLAKYGNGRVIVHRVEGISSTRDSRKKTRSPANPMTSISFQSARDDAWIIVDPEAREVKDAILGQAVVTFDDPAEFAVHGGFQPPVDLARSFELGAADIGKLTAVEREHAFRLVHDAHEIQRYVIKSQEPRYWVVTNDIPSERELAATCPNLHAILRSRLDPARPGWWQFPNVRNLDVIASTPEKILAPRTASTPCFALDDRKSVFKGTNTMIVPKRLNARYVVGVLNSKLAAFWQDTFGFGYHGGIAKKLEPSKVRKTLLPIKVPSATERDGLITLVNEMIERLEARAGSQAIAVIQREIDASVFDLYGIRGRLKDFIDARIDAW